MDQKQRERRNFFQNILITLLSFSAVLLFVATQINVRESLFSSLPEANITSGTANSENDISNVPVRVAVNSSYGRFGSVTLTTADESFAPLGSLLRDALDAAPLPSPCSEQEFYAALDGISVYYDFLASLPLSILGNRIGASGPDDISARYLTVSAESGNVTLYLRNDAAEYFSCPTTLSAENLETVISDYEQANTMFAYEAEQEYGAYAASIHPLSLFLSDDLPSLPIFSAAKVLSGSSALLSALSFNPYTQTRWTESSGTEVIVDGDRTLRFYSDGTLSYRSGGSNAVSISTQQDLTLAETARKAEQFLTQLLPVNSEAELYLTGVSRTAASTVFTFEYHLNGIPIRFSNGESAAKITMIGSTVSSIFMSSREYQSSDSSALMLPLHQALAIASKQPRAELLLGYADYGDTQISPRWLCE